MWLIAGVLLGCALLASLAGFHIGPISHAAAAVFGVAAAAWLIAMALSGQSAPVLWSIFGADLVLSVGLVVLAWKGLQSSRAPSAIPPTRLDGAVGVTESALDPDGVVKLKGETWSATSLNGDLPVGARVQVVRVNGVRLEVWGEDVDSLQGVPFVINHHRALPDPGPS